MKYAYFPGCSLEKTQRGYDASVREVFSVLGQELIEIDDWNCCGATVYMSVEETVSLAVAARNLALAEHMEMEILAPCSSCYTILAKTNRVLQELPALKADVNEALAEGGLSYSGRTVVRHPLDILMNDIGIDAILQKQQRRLNGIAIAPYYGCQIVRPDKTFDDRDNPVLLDRLFEALGAQTVPYPMKVRCCGGMLMTTFKETGLKLNRELLGSAQENGAHAIVTTCPLCHFNLEVYQKDINKAFGTSFAMPVLYFTQLLGVALGIPGEKLGLDASLAPLGEEIVSLMEVHHA